MAAAPAPGRARVPAAGRDPVPRTEAQRARGLLPAPGPPEDSAAPARRGGPGSRGPVRRPHTRTPQGEKVPARPRKGPPASSRGSHRPQRRTHRGPRGERPAATAARAGPGPSPPPLPCRSEAPPCWLRVFMMTLRSSRASPAAPQQPPSAPPRQRGRRKRTRAETPPPRGPGKGATAPRGTAGPSWGAGLRQRRRGQAGSPAHAVRGRPRVVAAVVRHGAPGKRRKWRFIT